MLSSKVRQKLNAMIELPSIPTVLTAILNEMDDENFSTKSIATLIEQDQGLTARIIRVANSPFYGIARFISSIDHAIIILGSNTIKEIIVVLLTQRIFQKTNSKIFNTKKF